MTDTKCTKCGESLDRAMLLALIIDFGAQTNADPSKCPDGGYHDFEIEEAAAHD